MDSLQGTNIEGPNLPERTPAASQATELAVAIVAVVFMLAVTWLSSEMAAWHCHFPKTLSELDPHILPDVGWLATERWGGGGTMLVATVSTVAPTVAMFVCGIAILVTQKLFTLLSFLNGWSILMTLRAIVILCTNHPPIWTVKEQWQWYEWARGKFGKGRWASKLGNMLWSWNMRQSLMYSGHTVHLVYPVFFLAVLLTDPGSNERALALSVVALICVIPLITIFSSRIHRTDAVMVAVILAVTFAFICGQEFVGLRGTVPVMAFAVLIVAINLIVYRGRGNQK